MLFEGMRQVATQKQWHIDPADPGATDAMPFRRVTLTGTEEGVVIRLERCAGNHSFTTAAVFGVAFPWSFVISHQGLGGDLASLIGFEDIEVGDPEFDRTFRIVSNDVEKTKALLTAEVQAKLKDLDRAATGFGSRFEVTNHAVSLTRAYFTPMASEEVLRDVPTVIGALRALRSA